MVGVYVECDVVIDVGEVGGVLFFKYYVGVGVVVSGGEERGVVLLDGVGF